MTKYQKPAKITWKNIKRFIQGWKRYLVYILTKRKGLLSNVSDSLHLLSPEKREQFEWRLTVMNKECLSNEKCIICGCEVPQLQMINDGCEGNCYPDMMSKEDWEQYKKDNGIII